MGLQYPCLFLLFCAILNVGVVPAFFSLEVALIVQRRNGVVWVRVEDEKKKESFSFFHCIGCVCAPVALRFAPVIRKGGMYFLFENFVLV